MEFLDDDPRPRFHMQSRPFKSSLSDPVTHQKPLSKLFLSFTVVCSLLLLIFSIIFLQIEPFRSLLFWVSISLLIGPFAPSQLTGGDIRVGQGAVLEPIEQEPEIVTEKQARKKRSKPIRSEECFLNSIPAVEMSNGLSSKEVKIEPLARCENGMASNEGEKEWSEADMDFLKKQMVKNPVGKPRRWEVIAEAFNGRHRVESVINKAKELGEKKLDDADSYTRFLKNRKPLGTRVNDEQVVTETAECRKDNDGWSSGEDIALLNALKVFPKDVAMRWEKIAAAVPGKPKAACMKRVAELKRDFRSSKAGAS
ncbi:hypothetical protein K2173_019238 [Erythroxylum novogranatense]|uniref:Myb-like domain-containing protein n=1 Tax=Erythroxylum novogranatense TaxID=1862640 RepID=A0AAV8ST60_9ROSI|nr:hypothetical protein K2173_019238 [Erythroxylum novogranatense]